MSASGVPVNCLSPAGFPTPSRSRLTQASLRALVPFPEAGLLGTVTGFCFSPDDIDVATVFTATIAHRMTVVRGAGR